MKFRRLTIGFFVALMFCVANLYSYFRMPEYSTMDDGFVYFGWPFSIYAYGGYFGHAVIIWTGLIGNVFLALCACRILVRIIDTVLIPSKAFVGELLPAQHLVVDDLIRDTPPNKRWERTRHERASLVSCVGAPAQAHL